MFAGLLHTCLNESPSEKEGKYELLVPGDRTKRSLNESPSEKEGKFFRAALFLASPNASMKVPPKRKGNTGALTLPGQSIIGLNESPSEKEGKFSVRIDSNLFRFLPQ